MKLFRRKRRPSASGRGLSIEHLRVERTNGFAGVARRRGTLQQFQRRQVVRVQPTHLLAALLDVFVQVQDVGRGNCRLAKPELFGVHRLTVQKTCRRFLLHRRRLESFERRRTLNDHRRSFGGEIGADRQGEEMSDHRQTNGWSFVFRRLALGEPDGRRKSFDRVDARLVNECGRRTALSRAVRRGRSEEKGAILGGEMQRSNGVEQRSALLTIRSEETRVRHVAIREVLSLWRSVSLGAPRTLSRHPRRINNNDLFPLSCTSFVSSPILTAENTSLKVNQGNLLFSLVQPN